jgi:hypothetical protein
MEIFYYLLLTILIELPVVIFFYRKSWQQALIVGLLLNAFTWPLLQLALEYMSRDWIPLLELIIVLVEGFGYYVFIKQRLSFALLVSLLANGLSYGIGFLIN